MDNRLYSKSQLLSMEACTGCAACAEACPAVNASGDGQLSGLYRLDWRRRAGKAGSGWLGRIFGGKAPSEEQWQAFSDTVFRCTLCGNCAEVCPAGIGLKDIWLSLRQELVEQKAYPAKVDLIRENLNESRNVFGEEQEERAEWVEDLDEPPDDLYVKDAAEVVYFTGCVASFFPLAQQIPLALAEVLEAASVEFTLLGEEEWCCGFPLLGAGDLPAAQEMIEHNLAAVAAKGAKEVVFACPSCYMMWREHYPTDLKLSHATQYLERLVAQGRVPLRNRELTVTYHDPCDLGRAARVFEEPRRLIRSLPGVKLVELADNREHCLCCGGGGNLEMIDQELNAEIAKRKVDQVLATGAETVVSGCQQCLRTMATHARRNKLPLKVLDVAQLVRDSLDT
ncbi:(Fe-S)-binding protein [Desulfoferula mesophila]|uniref:Disulfide reductase n=1 Tax=Desulfoferula mesophila TaxID=3058419 RepID=A0AAU9ECV1_9BACT|nr:disulfide reductase [Desulfoferula mesophilus]